MDKKLKIDSYGYGNGELDIEGDPDHISEC
jgi:hypothetical protein